MTSSSYDPSLDAALVMGVVDATTEIDRLVRPGQPVLVVDALSQDWQEVLASVTQWTSETWRGGKLTTACWRHQGTESAWLLTLAFNGLGLPTELRAGMLVRYPDIGQIRAAIAARRTPRTGAAGRVISI